MDKRIKEDVQQIAGIVSGLLLYLDDCERQAAERARQQVLRLVPNEDRNMTKFSDGSFRQRGNKLEYRFMLDGKQRTVYGATKAECFSKREQAIRDAGQPEVELKPVTAREVMTLLTSIQTNTNVAGSSEPFGVWVQTWYEKFKRAHLKGHTQRSYERHLQSFYAQSIAAIPLKELTGEHLQAYFDSITQGAKRAKLVQLLNPALKKAVTLRMLAFNPFDAVELPKHKWKHRKALTFAQQITIFFNVTGKYEAAAWVLCCTGLRVGEFLGLNYATDVDYAAGTITVHGGIDIYDGSPIDCPKTENGNRVIRFLPALIPYLKICQFERFTYTMLRLYFDRLFKRLDIVECSLYTFRHTFISLCAYVGIPPKYIQSLAGHASIVTTFDIYTDPLENGTSPLLEYFEKLSYFYPKMT